MKRICESVADRLRKIPPVSALRFASSSGSREVELLPVSPSLKGQRKSRGDQDLWEPLTGNQRKGKEPEQLDGGGALKQGPPLC
ncbi:hypothetical protein CesoFtcFv8_001594 [Champsocephalus esox]|uniref:Uncharacterized protein n=1 Tax=Champsocephalus esox TaxID=159716 RepID=A0AAN8HI07_9TELE|nr:hypothetical protein CesoFtcFv8_001594 [Champsocephalus esox]